jgi:hypothetical protein
MGLLAFVLAAAPSAAPAPPAPPQAQPARIFDVTAAHGVDSGRAVGPTATFTPDTNPIYVWFQYEGLPAGTTITSVWYYLGTDTPTRIEQAAATTVQGANSGQFNLELAAGKAWPEGAYRVDLLVDGKVVAMGRFTVARAMPGVSPAEPARYTHPRAGFELSAPGGWTLNDQVSTADLRMTPAQGAGLMEITSGPTSTRLDPVSYAAGWESASVGPDKLLRRKRAGRPITVDGEAAYEGVYEGEGVLAKVVFVGFSTRFFVLTGVFKSDDYAPGEATFDRMAQSFRARRLP